MKFFHKGVKKSNETSKSEGCIMIIGFVAFIFFLTLLDDIDDLKDHFFEVFAVVIMAGSVLFSIFSKRGKLSNYHITLKNEHFLIEKASIPINDIVVDVYLRNENFNRYHLRDKKGNVAIFSVINDDLYKHFKENLPNQVFEHQEISSKHEGAYISVIADNQKLYYDLSRGKYTIAKKGKPEFSKIPDVYTYDPEYKLGKPLLKSKT